MNMTAPRWLVLSVAVATALAACKKTEAPTAQAAASAPTKEGLNNSATLRDNVSSVPGRV